MKAETQLDPALKEELQKSKAFKIMTEVQSTMDTKKIESKLLESAGLNPDMIDINMISAD